MQGFSHAIIGRNLSALFFINSGLFYTHPLINIHFRCVATQQHYSRQCCSKFNARLFSLYFDKYYVYFDSFVQINLSEIAQNFDFNRIAMLSCQFAYISHELICLLYVIRCPPPPCLVRFLR